MVFVILKQKKFIIVVCATVLCLSFFAFMNLYKLCHIKYELVYEFTVNNTQNFDKLPWFTLVDSKYQPFFDEDYLTNENGLNLKENIDYDFDYDNYSYIVCCGHKLKELRPTDVKKRVFLVLPYEISATATLEKEKSNIIYVYRIRKFNIACDYHNMAGCTLFE